MHIEPLNIDIQKTVDLGPISFPRSLDGWMWILILCASLILCYSAAILPHELMWGALYTNIVFFTGLSAGGVMITVILQIVKAQWAPPVRRLAEANVAFLPYAWIAIAMTYFGKDYLFYWGSHPMPGREWWMQPEFVYTRHLVLLAILFVLLTKFVRMSLRGDVGIARERSNGRGVWGYNCHDSLVAGWKGEEEEMKQIDHKRAYFAPALIFLYAIIYSLFAFEMIMAMDKTFSANMFGGFVFIGNIYAGWAALSLAVILMRRNNPAYAQMARGQQLHDLGKLTLGFGVLWAYLFFSHFMPIWYGNLPEETQWVILRLRENPWRILAWTILGCCFIAPFMSFLSRDIKKTPTAFGIVCCIILFGLWAERYILIMPQLSPTVIPIGLMEFSFFLGFLGIYILSFNSFLKKYPIVPLSDPRIRDSHH